MDEENFMTVHDETRTKLKVVCESVETNVCGGQRRSNCAVR